MRHTGITRKRIVSGLSLLLCLSLLLAGCAGNGVSKSKIGARTEETAKFTDRQYHITNTNNLIYVAKSGLIELYFDSVTYGMGVRETGRDKTWLSLPVGGAQETGAGAAVVTVRVSGGGTVYTLNSQDNSVAFGSASFKPSENGLQVTYDMALDSDTANSAFDALPENALYVSVTVQYILTDGALHVKVNCGEMLVSSGYTVETLTLLDHFGATGESAAADDYILVPDGGGAIDQTAALSESEDTARTFLTYGADPALGDRPQTLDERVAYAASVIPAYGMKCGENAFLAFVESGDGISEIRENRCTGADTYNRVGTTFRVTDTVLRGKDGKQTLYMGTPYVGEVGVCYRFLSDRNASYSGMATACRELLIRSGILSTKTVVNTEYAPMLVAVQAAADSGKKAVLSDYKQTLELLKRMKAKGINNVFLRYNGVLEGAGDQQRIGNIAPASVLGNRKAFEELAQYANTQQFTLYLNTDICTSNRNGQASAKTVFGKAASISVLNPFSEFAGEESFTRFALALSEVDADVTGFIDTMQKYDFGGYCIDDAGRLLYSDYSRAAYSRTGAQNLLSTQATTLSVGHKLMVDTGNVYMLKNADVVADLPSETTYPQTDSYYAVPFVQMVLHGIVEYAHAPANLSENSEAAFLKAMEYGALPAFAWTFRQTGNENLDAVYHYEAQINRAAEQYIKANELLGDLRDARMTAHEKVQQGVYRTEYNNSIVLYFNYNDAPVTVNSITVAPMSALRVN